MEKGISMATTAATTWHSATGDSDPWGDQVVRALGSPEAAEGGDPGVARCLPKEAGAAICKGGHFLR